MLKEQSKLLTKIAVSIDVAIIFAAFFSTVNLYAITKNILYNNARILWIPLIATVIFLYINYKFKLYSTLRTYTVKTVIFKLLQSTALSSMIMFTIAMTIRERIPVNFYLTFFAFIMVYMCIQKIIMKYILYYFRKKGYNTRHILIVGTKEKGQEIHGMINEHSEWGLKVVGYVSIYKDATEFIKDVKVMGHIDDIFEIVKSNSIDEVVICLPKNISVVIETKIKGLIELGLNVQFVVDFLVLANTRFDVSLFHNKIPMLTFTTKSQDAFQLMIKRLLDIVGAFIGLFITGIFFPFVAVAIKMEDGGPIFFKQIRIGMYNREFELFKFRSMQEDAEEQKDELLCQNEMCGAIFKIKDDPRVTKVGSFLRKTSLDEFPQFYNVLIGDMSLVGTRPPTLDEVDLYENWHRRRISIKPGITGMWQVSGRNEITQFDEIVRLDLEYIDKWSIWLDIKILLKTLLVVIKRKGSR